VCVVDCKLELILLRVVQFPYTDFDHVSWGDRILKKREIKKTRKTSIWNKKGLMLDRGMAFVASAGFNINNQSVGVSLRNLSALLRSVPHLLNLLFFFSFISFSVDCRLYRAVSIIALPVRPYLENGKSASYNNNFGCVPREQKRVACYQCDDEKMRRGTRCDKDEWNEMKYQRSCPLYLELILHLGSSFFSRSSHYSDYALKPLNCHCRCIESSRLTRMKRVQHSLACIVLSFQSIGQQWDR
jgi:hypothetical protein